MFQSLGSARLAALCWVNQAVLATSRQGSSTAGGFVSNVFASTPIFPHADHVKHGKAEAVAAARSADGELSLQLFELSSCFI